MADDAVLGTLDSLLQGQSVMLATNDLLWLVAAAFAVASTLIWIAPRPTRSVDMTQAGY